MVHLCHFDFGFTNVRWCVLAWYIETVFPKVLGYVGQNSSYVYQTQPFLVFAFLNCAELVAAKVVLPQGIALPKCPSAAAIASMEAAIRSGNIVYQRCERAPAADGAPERSHRALAGGEPQPHTPRPFPVGRCGWWYGVGV